jgi:hypothetical protein
VGDKFAIVNGKLSDEYGYCLLANHDYLLGKQELPVTGRNGQCEPGLRARIPSLESRQLAACFLLATLGGGAHLLAVEYQRREKNLLAALVLLTPSGVFTETLFCARRFQWSHRICHRLARCRRRRSHAVPYFSAGTPRDGS